MSTTAGVWILILSMVGRDGVAIDHVLFPTNEACTRAGELWMRTTFPELDRHVYRTTVPNYICVSTQ